MKTLWKENQHKQLKKNEIVNKNIQTTKQNEVVQGNIGEGIDQCREIKIKSNKTYRHTHNTSKNCSTTVKEADSYNRCRKLGLPFCFSELNETNKQITARQKLNLRKIAQAQKKLNITVDELPPPAPPSNDSQYNKAMDCIRAT